MRLNDLTNRYQNKLISYTRRPDKGPNITVIGGGTGLSTLLRGLKNYSHNITAVVSVADNGGSSGLLRKDLGIIPPGDIRNCIMALADTEPLMSELMDYRFQDGSLQGQNFGNLFLAALSAVCDDNFYDAIRNFSNVLAVTGTVLPVSLTNLNISAMLSDGSVIEGESAIGSRKPMPRQRIERIVMDPEDAPALPESLTAIRDADLVVIGPGSLYTSIVPTLLFKEVVQAIEETSGHVVYICNLMTQPEETYQYCATDHLNAILLHAGRNSCHDFIDYCVVNNAPIPFEYLENYAELKSEAISCNPGSILRSGAALIQTPLASTINGIVRHDHLALGKVVALLAAKASEEKLERAKTKVYRNWRTL
ncbi:MAG: gluconeogenesis factor YvcK family protein [Fastidiosipilaceae bacterium]|jgi:uncharacterized cofD-like protein